MFDSLRKLALGAGAAADAFGAAVRRGGSIRHGGRARGQWEFVARDSLGVVKWRERIAFNLVVNQGLDYLLDSGLSAAAQVTTWYLFLSWSLRLV